MCREALATYLVHETQIDEERLAALLDEAETGTPVLLNGEPKLSNQTLPRWLRQRIDRVLASVRVLDPAVGSGAFPLGMLALLVGVRRALYRIEDVAVAPHSHMIEGWKRDFIRDCLYGVDIKQEAVEIARLRLWLSLVVDANPFDMEPLPNLDYKLMAGNSLIETCEGVEIYPSRPIKPKAAALEVALFADPTKELIQKLKALTNELYQPQDSVDKAELMQTIAATEVAIVRSKLEERSEKNAVELKKQTGLLATGQEHILKKMEPKLHEFEREDRLTQQSLQDIAAGKTLPFFLYRLHFASVFEEKDGFDIVIANPPYVRHEKISADITAELKRFYPEVAHGMADLYVYFYARGLQLLHTSGTLSFITSNKFFRTGYGKKLCDTLTKETQVKLLLDFGDRPVFDAAAYPCMVVTSKNKPQTDHYYTSWTASPTFNVDELNKLEAYIQREGLLQMQEDGVAPAWGTLEEQTLAKKLRILGTPLGEYVHRKLFYGIKTGLNEAFIVDQATHDRFITEDPRSAEILKPFLRGKDIGRYQIVSNNLWLIKFENGFTNKLSGRSDQKLSEHDGWELIQVKYPAIARHLEPFADKARKRDDKGQYWWELRACVYYKAFEQPKIIFPDISRQPRFVWTDSTFFIGNTAYCIPTEQVFLCGLLNSKLIHFVYPSISSKVRGGYFRFIYQNMEQLPIIEPTEKLQQSLRIYVSKMHEYGYDQELQQEIDNTFYMIYGLTQNEINTIEEWHSKQAKILDVIEDEDPLESEDE